MTDKELLKKHRDASEAYYESDEPIMTDEDFNSLENEILKRGLTPIYGSEYGAEEDHPTHMYSLKKFNVNKDESNLELLWNDIQKWFKKSKSFNKLGDNLELVAEYKWDGLAINATYQDGVLQKAITRGKEVDGSFKRGRNVLEKIKHLIPSVITDPDITEIRMECVVPWDTFIEKYDEYSHPRNLASGILADENMNDPRIQDLRLKIHGVKRGNKCINDMSDLTSFFKVNKFDGLTLDLNEVTYLSNDFDSFVETYKLLDSRRKHINIPTDGFVLKLVHSNVFNSEIEDDSDGHYPYHSVAVKFIAKGKETTITDVKYILKKSGVYNPTVFYTPIEIDGRIHTKCNGFNHAFILENGCGLGAKIEITINGDIIPNLNSVIEPSNDFVENPTGSYAHGKFLYSNKDNPMIKVERFVEGCLQLKIDGLGHTTYRKIAEFCDYNWVNLFTSSMVDIKDLIGSDKATKLFYGLNLLTLNGMTINHVLKCMQFKGLSANGRTLQEVAKLLSNLSANTKGLTKDDIDNVIVGEGYKELNESIESLKKSLIKVSYLELEEEPQFEFVMTGSPKPHYNTKAEFVKTLPLGWKEIKSVKDGCVLITDDLNSTTGKMKKAIDLNNKGKNVIVKSYESF